MSEQMKERPSKLPGQPVRPGLCERAVSASFSEQVSSTQGFSPLRAWLRTLCVDKLVSSSFPPFLSPQASPQPRGQLGEPSPGQRPP